MARIAGVNIPNHKHAEIALTAIYGIGRNTAKQICQAAGVSTTVKVKDLNDAEVEKLRDEVAKIKVEGDLRREVTMNRLVKVQSSLSRHPSKQGIMQHGQS